MTDLRRRRQRAAGLVIVAALAVVVIALLARTTGDTGRRSPDAAPSTSAAEPSAAAVTPEQAADRFLDAYVAGDGRVVRHDQGGDTVSEGQAYALLLAVAADDPARFSSVWAWTQAELQRADGLLAWHWADGVVVDDEPAADADVDAARALVLAAEQFGEDRYAADARRLADAIVEHETVAVSDGRILTAGPWAAQSPPYVVNPSYISPTAFDLLAAATGDTAWADLAATGRDLLADVTVDGDALPPDWAAVDATGTVTPTGAPGGDADPRYGYDAFRTVVRLAEDCEPAGRTLAADLAPVVERTVAGEATAYALDGEPVTEGANPVLLVAAAASRAAADDDSAGDLLLAASRAEAETPSYYLAAWAGLGATMLDRDVLGGCPPGLDERAPSDDADATSDGCGASEVDLGATVDPASALDGLDLRCADLTGLDLGGADLSGRDLTRADLAGADLTGADLRSARLTDASLAGASLLGADLAGADLTGVDLRGAAVAPLTGRGLTLSGARLAGLDLGGSDLTDADLGGADLSGADLRSTDLTGADLADARLSGAHLTDADLTGTTWTGAQCPDGRTAAPACRPR